jgi:hypothetical protein
VGIHDRWWQALRGLLHRRAIEHGDLEWVSMTGGGAIDDWDSKGEGRQAVAKHECRKPVHSRRARARA